MKEKLKSIGITALVVVGVLLVVKAVAPASAKARLGLN